MVGRRVAEAAEMRAGDARLPLLYRTLAPLAVERHSGLCMRTEPDFGFASAIHAVPVTADEFPQAMRSYPIVMTAGAKPMPVALVGFEAGRNDHVDANGAWTPGAHVPAYLRRYPFFLLREAKTSDRMVLCADLTSAVFSEVPGAGTPLFEGGRPGKRLSAILDFCNRFETAMARTRALMAEANRLGLFRPSAVTATKGGRNLRLEGFSIISEERLRALPAATLADLDRRGVLGLFAAHQYSIGNFSDVGTL